MPARLLVVAILAAVLVGVTMTAVDTQFRRSGERVTVENETFDAALAGPVNLSQSNIDNATYVDDKEVRVRNTTGVLLKEGEDYEWNETDGVVVVLPGGNLEGEVAPTIDYGLWLHSQDHQSVRDLWTTVVGFQRWAALIIGLAAVLMAIRVLAGVG